MPFKKVGTDDYTSPSGRHFNQKQVNLYYATNGFKEKPMAYAKGHPHKQASYAQGGAVIGKTSQFMKTPDEFREPDHANPAADEDQKYGKAGEGSGKGCVQPPAQRKSKVLK